MLFNHVMALSNICQPLRLRNRLMTEGFDEQGVSDEKVVTFKRPGKRTKGAVGCQETLNAPELQTG
jgi:hypothetical protein